MDPAIRRIIAVDVQRRRTGRCSAIVHALGSGESFRIAPAPDGFTDVTSGLRAWPDGRHIVLSGGRAPIRIELDDDVGFSGFDPKSGEGFTGRAGGGSSVTVYEGDGYYQFALVNESGL